MKKKAEKWQIRDKVFKNRPSKICGRQLSENLKGLSRPYPFKFFKGCLPQISFGPFLNTLSHIVVLVMWQLCPMFYNSQYNLPIQKFVTFV